MNQSELAAKILRWEELNTVIGRLAKEIEEEVLSLGKTQDVGNIRVTYSKGRRSFDYKAAGSREDEETIKKYTKTTVSVTTNWKKMCDELRITDIPFTQGNPSAKIKINKKKKEEKTTTKLVPSATFVPAENMRDLF